MPVYICLEIIPKSDSCPIYFIFLQKITMIGVIINSYAAYRCSKKHHSTSYLFRRLFPNARRQPAPLRSRLALCLGSLGARAAGPGAGSAGRLARRGQAGARLDARLVPGLLEAPVRFHSLSHSYNKQISSTNFK